MAYVKKKKKGLHLLKFIENRIRENKNFIACITGETGCLSHDTLLMGYTKTLGELYSDGIKEVDTYSFSKSNMYAKTKSLIIDSGIKEVYEIEFEDGDKVLATEEHRFFKKDNHRIEEVEVKDLKMGNELRSRYLKDINEYYESANERQKKKTCKNFNPTGKCSRCSDEYKQELGHGLNRTLCGMCQTIGGKNYMDYSDMPKVFGSSRWLPEDDLVLIKFYYSKSKEFILSQLDNNKNWRATQKRANAIGLRRSVLLKAETTRKRNLEDNPAKKKEAREKKSKQMKEYFRKNPHKSPNIKMRRNHITDIEKKMKYFLMSLFSLKEDKDFFFNHYMKVDGTYKFPDFIIPNKNLIIECDGLYWHDAEKDKTRDNLLIGRGYDVLHFSCQQINKNPLEVIECLQKRLSQ